MSPRNRFFVRRSAVAVFAVWGIALLSIPGQAADPPKRGRSAKPSQPTADPPKHSVSLPSPTDKLSAEVDRLINEAAAKAGVTPSPLVSDEDFLRRVSLDLGGTIPSAPEISLFVLNPAADKRAQVINRLLESPGYAEIWSAYWADVVYSRATDPRTRTAQGVFESWLKTQFQKNRPWDEITTEILTATGKVQEEGQTALIFAHQGDAAEVAAEVSRIFLGIQIQCANCHDHPSDIWKREQFHQLAAYFPRMDVRRDPQGGLVDFIVTAHDSGREGRMDPEMMFKFLDANRDGKITKAEAEKAPKLSKLFEKILENGDANHDGAITLEELKSMPKPDGMGKGELEYHMSDLENPKAQGKQMTPVFFVTGESLKLGTSDHDRRQALAREITGGKDPWFAKAFVNRIWGELLGEGFYMPIDDLGPKRTAQLPEVLERLADGFRAQHFDIKWLYRTIANTTAYQRSLRTRPADEPQLFAAASPTRLRSDQVFHALSKILQIQEMAGLPTLDGPRFTGNRTRRGFHELFGHDPSTPQEELLGSIPQALFLMNSPTIQQYLKADRDTVPGRILREFSNDEDALRELYLQFLSREPSRADLDLNLAYIQRVNRRTEAFEDIAWSLLNSSEVLTKR